MSIHYAKYANKVSRVEYIGKKQRDDCVKTIEIGDGQGDKELVFILFSPDGTELLSCSEQGVVCIWDTTSGELIVGPLDNKTKILSAAYLPGGRDIIVATKDGVIRKWDIATSRLVWEKAMGERRIHPSDWLKSAVFSPKTNLVVFGDDQGEIQIWNVETGGQDGEPLKGHTGTVTCLSFSPNGRYLVSGSSDTTVIVWNMRSREIKTGPLRGHDWGVMTVLFLPNGNDVISGSKDCRMCCWNVSTGKTSNKLVCKGQVKSATCSANGSLILAGVSGYVGWERR